MKDDKIYIVGAVRTAIGKYGGVLKDIDLIDLGAQTLKGALQKSEVKAEDIDQVHIGCCIQSTCKDGVAPVIARQILLKAGLRHETVSTTIDKACTSSSTAIKMACDAIKLGRADVVIAGGLEIMSATPYLNRNMRFGSKIGDVNVEDPLYPIGYKDYSPVAVDAGNVALEYGVSRHEQDEFAFLSQMKYQDAKGKGKFDDEIIPILIPRRKGESLIFVDDEFPKPNTSMEKLSNLKTVFNSKTITAGNAPGLNDGAALLVLISESKLKELKLQALGEFKGFSTVADRPDYIPVVPAKAIQKVLKNEGVKLEEIDLIEINEAFAAMPLVSAKILEDEKNTYQNILGRINVNGGSIAIGHPVGASGARIVVTLIHELNRRGGGKGVAAICGGLAQGDAILVNA